MRLGLVLEPSPSTATLTSLTRQAHACERSGIDLAWLGSGHDGGAEALARVAALAPATSALRLAAAVPAGDHPLRIAEEATVADNCSNGRLVLVLVDTTDDVELLSESVDVLMAATSARPFRHHGARWTIPARRPENGVTEQRVRLTPPPAQLELPIWLAGPAAPAPARRRCLSHVSATGDAPGRVTREWAATETQLGPAAARLRRPAVRALDAATDGSFDADELVIGLLSERDHWGLDVAIIRLPSGLTDSDRGGAIAGLAALVAPRIQLDALPAELERHWRERLVPTKDEVVDDQ